jgi:hypothetical protein
MSWKMGQVLIRSDLFRSGRRCFPYRFGRSCPGVHLCHVCHRGLFCFKLLISIGGIQNRWWVDPKKFGVFPCVVRLCMGRGVLCTGVLYVCGLLCLPGDLLNAFCIAGAIATFLLVPSLMCLDNCKSSPILFIGRQLNGLQSAAVQISGSCSSTQVLLAFTWICSICRETYFIIHIVPLLTRIPDSISLGLLPAFVHFGSCIRPDRQTSLESRNLVHQYA